METRKTLEKSIHKNIKYWTDSMENVTNFVDKICNFKQINILDNYLNIFSAVPRKSKCISNQMI